MGGPLLAIDTATRTAVVALGDADGRVLAEVRWSSQHRHGAELLARLEALLVTSGRALGDLGGVVVGIGPGSFTGLRVGLATAKVIAYSIRVPLVAVSSMEALAWSALGAAGHDDRVTGERDFPGRVAVLLPAGATDRYRAIVVRGADGLPRLEDEPGLVAGWADGGAAATLAAGPPLIAVDLDPAGLPPEAAEAGTAAAAGLGAGLLALGARGLRSGATIDPAELVPAYVAMPRGVTDVAQGMAWSPDLR